jgi:hypothetical protein
LLELDGDEANEKMAFHEIGLCPKQSLCALGCPLGLALCKEREALPKRVLHPGRCPDVGACHHSFIRPLTIVRCRHAGDMTQPAGLECMLSIDNEGHGNDSPAGLGYHRSLV